MEWILNPCCNLVRSLRRQNCQPIDATRGFRKWAFSLLDTHLAGANEAFVCGIESQIGRFVKIGTAADMDTFRKPISHQAALLG